MTDYTFFETLLNERLDKLYKNIEHKNTHITQFQNAHHKDESDVVRASLEGSLEMRMIDLYHNEICDIRNSLQKIKDGIFGICEMCDDEIDIERLKVKPHAKYCINCRELFEKKRKKEQS